MLQIHITHRSKITTKRYGVCTDIFSDLGHENGPIMLCLLGSLPIPG